MAFHAVSPSAVDRDWCWLSVTYGFGDESISLAQILKAREENNRYIGTASGWVDTRSDEVETIAAMAKALPEDRFDSKGESIRLNRKELFQFSALDKKMPDVEGQGETADRLSRVLALQPSADPPDPGLTSTLREYQNVGLQWLWWLWENRFGGLLCDDMGLGKTHQIMALMSSMYQNDGNDKKFLVVCPSHPPQTDLQPSRPRG